MTDKKKKNIFIDGAIPPEMIAKLIANHQAKTEIGAHQFFLGQVRADVVDQKKVAAIEYTTADESWCNEIADQIREAAFSKYPLHCMHIYHSKGKVAVGDICFFVLVSSTHRSAVFESLPEIVNQLKEKLPIFGKEWFEDQTYQWKKNS